MTYEEEDSPADFYAAGKLASSQSTKSVSADNWNKGAVKKTKSVQDVAKLEKSDSRTDSRGATCRVEPEKDPGKEALSGALQGLKPRKRKRRKKKKPLTGEAMLQHALRGLNTTMNDFPDLDAQKSKIQATNSLLEDAIKGLKATPNRPLYEGDFEEFEETDYIAPPPNALLADARKSLRGNENTQHLFSRIEGRKGGTGKDAKKDKLAAAHNETLEDAKKDLKSAKLKREEPTPKPPKSIPRGPDPNLKNLSKSERLARLKAEMAGLTMWIPFGWFSFVATMLSVTGYLLNEKLYTVFPEFPEFFQ